MIDCSANYIDKHNKKIEVVELESGFLALTDGCADNYHIDELVLLIHSFNPACYKTNENNPKYETNRDKIVTEHKSPLLLGVEVNMLSATLDWLERLSPQGPRMMYLTNNSVSQPIQPPEEEFLKGLKDLFNPSYIMLGGAEIYYDKHSLFGGCVYGTYKRLQAAVPTTIKREYCWVIQRSGYPPPD